ncbi:hypothetical protein [Micromonospora okii]|uniref:hypothetical protein n=1 Tax=Micromonospora okii TaxID=1182970 RepID=UPI001E36A045|nr:hypothetical protein [Micromonospora okii]
MIVEDARERLVRFRGGFPVKPLDARRIAGLLEAPGCTRRQVLDAASIPMEDLVPLLGGRWAGSSPLALDRGRRFEQRVVANGMTDLLPLVRQKLGLQVQDIRQLDLSTSELKTQYPDPEIDLTRLRVKLTRSAVEQMLDGDQAAINLLRHPYLPLSLGDMPTHLEPDVVAFAASGNLAPLEIKSFSCVNGVADPVKVSEAARQMAVYLLGLRKLVGDLGGAKDRVNTSGLLVMTENLFLRATGHVINLRPQVQRLERTLRAFPDATRLAPSVPVSIELPCLPDEDAPEVVKDAAREQAREAVGALGMRFGDGCTRCPMLTFCRTEARLQDNVAQLGNQAANLCGDVGTVTAALELAAGTRQPDGAAEIAVADELRRASIALELAGARG